jgi:hypothetical protein
MLYRMMHGLVDVQPQQKLQVTHSRTDIYLHFFFPSATRLWNALSADVVASPSPPAFQSDVQGWMKAG